MECLLAEVCGWVGVYLGVFRLLYLIRCRWVWFHGCALQFLGGLNWILGF